MGGLEIERGMGKQGTKSWHIVIGIDYINLWRIEQKISLGCHFRAMVRRWRRAFIPQL